MDLKVILISRVQGIRKRERKSSDEEASGLSSFDTFFNRYQTNLLSTLSYDTKVKNNVLTYSTFEDANEKVKEIR